MPSKSDLSYRDRVLRKVWPTEFSSYLGIYTRLKGLPGREGEVGGEDPRRSSHRVSIFSRAKHGCFFIRQRYNGGQAKLRLMEVVSGPYGRRWVSENSPALGGA